jgi:hypothetical protein
MQLEIAELAAEYQQKTDEEIRELVRDFVRTAGTNAQGWRDAQVLLRLAPRTHDTLIELLLERDGQEELLATVHREGRPRTRFHLICELLGEHPPAAAASALAPFAEHPAGHVRRTVARTLARCGAPEIASPMAVLMFDQDEEVRMVALAGLLKANREGRVSRETGAALAPTLEELIWKQVNTEQAIDLLFELNPERAGEILQSDQMLVADNPVSALALESLARREVRVDRVRLAQLIATLEVAEPSESNRRLLTAAATALGMHCHSEDESFLRERLTDSRGHVAEAAALGLLAWNGLTNYEERLAKRQDSEGAPALPETLQAFLAVLHLDGQLRETSMAEYLYSPAGDRLSDVMAGLELIDAKEQGAVLKEAVGLFGKRGPSTVLEARRNQLGLIFGKDPEVFEGLDTRYHACQSSLKLLATNYVLENPEAFR